VRLVATFFREQVTNLRRRASRAMPGPMLIRLGVWACAVGAFLVAMPADVVFTVRGAFGLVVAAVLPALFPRGPVVTAAILTAVVGWILATTAYFEPITSYRLTALAGLLYALHTGAALAAVVPYDAVVSPGVLARWIVRAAGVVAVTAVFSAGAFAGARLVPAQTFVVASIAGVALAGAFAWVLAARK
jgi:hypothetical protein